MAEALGIDRSTYRLFVTGHNRAGRKIIGGVARAFPEVNVAYFAAQDVEMPGEGLIPRQGARDTANECNPTSGGGNGHQGTESAKEASDGLGGDLGAGADRRAGHLVARSGHGGDEECA